MKNTLQDLQDNFPMEHTLCVFKHKNSRLFLLGYLIFIETSFRIKLYGDETFFSPEDFIQFQYVLNDNGGFLYTNKQP